MADNNMMTYGLIALVALFALGYLNFSAIPGSIPAEDGVIIQGQPVTPVGGTQVTITNTTATLIAKNAFTDAQVIVEAAALRGGTVIDDANTIGGGNAVTVNPGEVLTLYFSNDNQTTGIDQSTAVSLAGIDDYYCPILEDVVMANEAGELVPNLTITALCYQESAYSSWVTDAGQRNSTSIPWDIGSTTTTDEDCVDVSIKAPNNAAYGNPYSTVNFVAVFDANTTLFQNIWVEGATKENASIPGVYKSTGDFASELSFGSIQNSETVTLTVCAKTVSGQDPSDDCNVTQSGTGCDIRIALMDPTSYFDEEGTGIKWAVEDEEDNSAIGYAEAFTDLTIYIQDTTR